MEYITVTGYDDRDEPRGAEASPMRQKTVPHQIRPAVSGQEPSSRHAPAPAPTPSIEAGRHPHHRNLEQDYHASGGGGGDAGDIIRTGDYENGREGERTRSTPRKSGNRTTGASSTNRQLGAARRALLNDADAPAPAEKNKRREDTGGTFVMAARNHIPRSLSRQASRTARASMSCPVGHLSFK
jgi:hypothetical protein